MYAGQVVEVRRSELLHSDPLHPYTAALAAARPEIDAEGQRGCGPSPAARCRRSRRPPASARSRRGAPYAQPACLAAVPELTELDGGLSRCIRAAELRGQLEAADA